MKFYKEVLNRRALPKQDEPETKEEEHPAMVELCKTEEHVEEDEYPQFLKLDASQKSEEMPEKKDEKDDEKEEEHVCARPKRRTAASNLLTYCQDPQCNKPQ